MAVYLSGKRQPQPPIIPLFFTTEALDAQTVSVAATHYSGKVIDGGTVDGVPTTATVTDVNNMHVVVEVTTMSSAGTLRFTGTSITEEDDAPSVGDTEDIAITGTGFQQTAKKWIGDVVISSVGGADVVLDGFRVTYFDNLNTDYKFIGYRLGWRPNSVSWDVALDIDRVETNGSKTNLVSKAFANTDSPTRAQNGFIGFAKETNREDAVIGSKTQGLVIFISGAGGSATKIQELQLTIFIQSLE